MNAPAYFEAYHALKHDGNLLTHTGKALGRAAHRLGCPACMSVLTAGGSNIGDVNTAIDAQIDVLTAALGNGDTRLALYLTVRALGEFTDRDMS